MYDVITLIDSDFSDMVNVSIMLYMYMIEGNSRNSMCLSSDL